jgi:hypothetical protein
MRRTEFSFVELALQRQNHRCSDKRMARLQSILPKRHCNVSIAECGKKRLHQLRRFVAHHFDRQLENSSFVAPTTLTWAKVCFETCTIWEINGYPRKEAGTWEFPARTSAGQHDGGHVHELIEAHCSGMLRVGVER